jgi:hypothetical protein
MRSSPVRGVLSDHLYHTCLTVGFEVRWAEIEESPSPGLDKAMELA